MLIYDRISKHFEKSEIAVFIPRLEPSEPSLPLLKHINQAIEASHAYRFSVFNKLYL